MSLFVAIVLLVLAACLVSWFLKYKAAGSEKRMMRMMKRVGVDPELARRGDARTILRDIRGRCQKCQNEYPCEQWLEGEIEGGNSFCPNAHIFEFLKENAEPVG